MATNLERAQRSRGNILALRDGEEIISREEFLSRLTDRFRIWKIAGGKLARSTGQYKGGTNNITNEDLHKVGLSGESGQSIDLYTRICWWQKDLKKIASIDPSVFTFTSKEPYHLGIRFNTGEYAGWTAFTLLSRPNNETLVYERTLKELESRQGQIQEFFRGIPIEITTSGGLDSDLRNIMTEAITLRRADTGEQLELRGTHDAWQAHPAILYNISTLK
ncbi:MAG: hypothetical protein HY225_01515 [Candidatus Vogelbacteria bacterium]|nr:hypothetical protein [Candidatus Vogelbacteria bacterium]